MAGCEQCHWWNWIAYHLGTCDKTAGSGARQVTARDWLCKQWEELGASPCYGEEEEMRDWEKDRKLCEAATPGPWTGDIRTGCYAIYPASESHNQCLAGASASAIVYQEGRGEEFAPGHYRTLTAEQEANAAFIAAAREGWPAALEEIERLRGAVDAMVIWRDGVPHYRTENDVPQQMPSDVERATRRALGEER